MSTPICSVFLKFSHFVVCISSVCASALTGAGFSITLSSEIFPSYTRTLRVAYCLKNSGLCVTTMTSLSLLTSFRSAATSFDALTSRLPVGSSARITGASFASARAMTVRCFSPPDSLLPRWFICFVSPTLPMSSFAILRRSFTSSIRKSASSTFSKTVRFSMMLKS